ncbi:hypothetical protein ACN6MY_13195 [Peribacillus sp. B-H-3]|uniref:hypothetical protein n=1 Tax=Peribacillus sp. B-H-3 TaxID=3400420 RepID=UPI003B01FBBB
MNIVWVINGLYLGPNGIWAYWSIGRVKVRHSHKDGHIHEHSKVHKKMNKEKPIWQSVFVSTSHCSGRCTLGDAIGALQEVPKSCVLIINRRNREVSIERPEIETFGENIGTLTREVFGLEVTQSGFHKLLLDVVEKIGDFDSTIDYFNDELGMEARAIIRALLLYRD